jgi:hypothetical protein
MAAGLWHASAQTSASEKKMETSAQTCGMRVEEEKRTEEERNHEEIRSFGQWRS